MPPKGPGLFEPIGILNTRKMKQDYLSSIRKQFVYYKSVGEKTFEQLADEDLFWQPNETSNSIAIIVNHLWGNMKSRWTDFLTTDGEKEWRNRDMEFETVITSRGELLKKWEDGWNCLFQALGTVTEENIDTVIHIRNKEHSIPEALHRQLAHYAYHIGQIVYIGVMIKGSAWKSLTIAKGKSAAFNKEMFSKGKNKGPVSNDLNS